jgi:hypothetical protein
LQVRAALEPPPKKPAIQTHVSAPAAGWYAPAGHASGRAGERPRISAKAAARMWRARGTHQHTRVCRPRRSHRCRLARQQWMRCPLSRRHCRRRKRYPPLQCCWRGTLRKGGHSIMSATSAVGLCARGMTASSSLAPAQGAPVLTPPGAKKLAWHWHCTLPACAAALPAGHAGDSSSVSDRP